MSGFQRLKTFVKSPHHAWLAVLTLGLGVASAQPWLALVGAGLYGLGWIFLPDSNLFRQWVAKKQAARQSAANSSEEEAFARERKRLYDNLPEGARQKYRQLGLIAGEVEQQLKSRSGDLPLDSPLHQLDSLMWTYLRLVHAEATKREFLERENDQELAREAAGVEKELEAMRNEIEQLEAASQHEAALKRQRLLESRQDRFETLKKRLARRRETRDDVELAAAEQQRIEELIKLFRVDLLAEQDAGSIGDRIGETAGQFSRTRQWLSDLRDLDDAAGIEDVPVEGARRVGYEVE